MNEKKIFGIGITLIFILLAGCAGSPDAGAGSAAGRGRISASADPALAGMRKGRIALPTGVFPDRVISSRLVKVYGKPLELEEEKQGNTQAGGFDDFILTYVYPEVSYTVFRSGYNDDESLLAARITGKDVRLENGLKIGMERDKVYDILGFPSIEDDISMIFYTDSGSAGLSYEYFLTVEKGRITEIRISGYGI